MLQKDILHSLEVNIGNIICKNGYSVSMKDYNVIFKIYLLDDIFLFCVLLTCINRSQFQLRKPNIDPFCGTCGLLIESLYLGSSIIGIDVQEKILEGAKKNIEYYNQINSWSNNYDLLLCDAKNIPFPDNYFDSIITDLPYGHSTIIMGISKEDLFISSFLEIYRVLKKDHLSVIIASQMLTELLNNTKFKLIKIYSQRVHKSLTRFIHLIKK